MSLASSLVSVERTTAVVDFPAAPLPAFLTVQVTFSRAPGPAARGLVAALEIDRSGLGLAASAGAAASSPRDATTMARSARRPDIPVLTLP